MFLHVIIVTVLCLSSSEGIFCENYFQTSSTNISPNCSGSLLDGDRFYLESNNESLSVRDVCEDIDFNNFNYLPKCCPPGHSYELSHHRCIISESSSICEDMDGVILIKSLLACPVMIDHLIEDDSVTIRDTGSIILYGKEYNITEYCLDRVVGSQKMIVRTCEDSSVCRERRCIRKCCRDGHVYNDRRRCTPAPHIGLSIENITRFKDRTDDFTGVITSKKCKRYKATENHTFSISKNGRIKIKELNVWTTYSVEDNMYCVEYFMNTDTYGILLCSIEYIHIRFMIYRGANIISCVCLSLTLIGYLTLKELKNFLGILIVHYSLCLLIAMVTLTYLQFKPNQEGSCAPIAFLVAFFMLAAFAWMNVLSFEIWRVLGSMSTHYGSNLYSEKKKLMWYSLYAWSIPIAIILIPLLDYHKPFLPPLWRPEIGLQTCVFARSSINSNYGFYLFFAGPCAVFLSANLIIFIKTIRYILQVKNDIAVMISTGDGDYQRRWRVFNIDKERVTMTVRIFIIMGLGWLFESVSVLLIDFSQSPILEVIEIIFDTFNCLQGFWIFCVFMLKRKIMEGVIIILKIRHPTRRSSNSCTTEVMVQPNNMLMK